MKENEVKIKRKYLFISITIYLAICLLTGCGNTEKGTRSADSSSFASNSAEASHTASSSAASGPAASGLAADTARSSQITKEDDGKWVESAYTTYDEKSQVTGHGIYEYDDKGELIHITRYNADGSLGIEQEWLSPDAKGNYTVMKSYFGGDLDLVITYTYREDGKKVVSDIEERPDEATVKSEYNWSDDDRQVMISKYGANDSPTGYLSKTYDSKGRLTLYINYSYSDQDVYKTSYTYTDDQTIEVEWIEVGQVPTGGITSIVTDKDDQGRDSETRIYCTIDQEPYTEEDLTQRMVYDYEEDGHSHKKTIYNDAGEITGTYVGTYVFLPGVK